jgi:hypothetical protein
MKNRQPSLDSQLHYKGQISSSVSQRKIEMHPASQTIAHPSNTGGPDTGVMTRSLRGQSFSRARPHLLVGRIMVAGMKTFIANRVLLQYRTRTEIHFFCAQSLAPETNNSPSRGLMNMKWRPQ